MLIACGNEKRHPVSSKSVDNATREKDVNVEQRWVFPRTTVQKTHCLLKICLPCQSALQWISRGTLKAMMRVRYSLPICAMVSVSEPSAIL